jgi:hypothetical protein
MGIEHLSGGRRSEAENGESLGQVATVESIGKTFTAEHAESAEVWEMLLSAYPAVQSFLAGGPAKTARALPGPSRGRD